MQKTGNELIIQPEQSRIKPGLLKDLSFPYKFVQPLSHEGVDDPISRSTCFEFIIGHPGWRVSNSQFVPKASSDNTRL